MVATFEPTPAVRQPAAEPIVLMAIPAGAWLALTDLTKRSSPDHQTARHLRRALSSITQIDTVIHGAVMVRDSQIEGISAHTHRSGAEGALQNWLRQQPELWPGLTIDDWRHLLEAGLAPVELGESTTLMMPVDIRRFGKEGHDR